MNPNPNLKKVAKRIALNMRDMSSAANNSPENLKLFMGLGLALAFCFEELTGHTCSDKKPLEVLQWALSLDVSEREAMKLQ